MLAASIHLYAYNYVQSVLVLNCNHTYRYKYLIDVWFAAELL